MILKDKIPFTLEIPMIGGLNEDDDPSAIGDGEFQVCKKVLLDHKVAEKFPEFTKVNPSNELESGAAIDGVFRCYADDGTARLIAVCNGKVYESSDWTTPIYSSLTAGKPCKFIPYRGKVIITNGYDYPVSYDPKTNTLGGSTYIESPQQIKKIAYMEDDETGWTGGAVDEETHVDTEWTGDSVQGRKLTAAATATETMETACTLDLSVHSDGSTADGQDFIDVSVYHRVLVNISSITLYLETSTGNYFSFTFDETTLDPEDQRDYQWTHIGIIRDRFSETGTGDWSTITKVKISLTAAASGSADPTFDNIRLRRSTVIPGPMRRIVATFEPSEETWVGGTLDVDKYAEGGCGIKLTDGDESAYCDKTIDLSKYVDGKTIPVADVMSVWVYINDTSKITAITLSVGDVDLSNYLAVTWTTEILAGTNFWQKLSIPIDDLGETGSHALEDTVRIYIGATIAAGGEITFDNWNIEFTDSLLQITEVEYGTSGENVTLSRCAWSTRYKSIGDYSIMAILSSALPDETYAIIDFDTPVDLSVWSDGIASTDEDYISFYSFMASDIVHVALEQLLLVIDVNNGDFVTDYYYFYLTHALGHFDDWEPGTEKIFNIAKGDFTRIGETGGKDWSTVKAIKWLLQPTYFSEGRKVFWIDDLKMQRLAPYSGEFQWKVVNRYEEIRSPASEASHWQLITRSKALITNIPTSNDSRVKERELYRKEVGGEDFRFSTTIPNNSSAKWVDDLYDAGPTMDEMGVPKGNILPPKGVTGLEYKERILLFQDLENLNSIAYTDPYLIYSWLSARLMPSEVVAGEVHFDNLFLFLRDGRVYRTSEDIDLAALEPLGEMLKCVSPWGECKVGEEIGIVTEDDIKLFNGYEARSIGKQLSPYLKQEDYKTEESVLFSHKDHLYFRVETRAGGAYKQFDCYIPGGQWEESYNEAFKSFCSYTGRGDKNEMVCGGYDGYLYKLDTSYNDNLEIRSKDFEEVKTSMGRGFGFHEKEVQEIRVIAKGGDSTSGSLTLKVYINGADSGVSRTIPASGHLDTVYHCYVVQLTGVENALVGQQLGYSLTHTTAAKNVKIKSVMISGEVIPLEQQYTG